jgi:hypothetical protein
MACPSGVIYDIVDEQLVILVVGVGRRPATAAGPPPSTPWPARSATREAAGEKIGVEVGRRPDEYGCECSPSDQPKSSCHRNSKARVDRDPLASTRLRCRMSWPPGPCTRSPDRLGEPRAETARLMQA